MVGASYDEMDFLMSWITEGIIIPSNWFFIFSPKIGSKLTKELTRKYFNWSVIHCYWLKDLYGIKLI